MFKEPIVITAMEGIFPGAPDTAALWDMVLHARVATPATLHAIWKKAAYMYLPDADQQAAPSYVDSAYLLADHPAFPYDAVNRQEMAGRYVCELLQAHLPVAARQHTGLVVGAQWPPFSYLQLDSYAHLQHHGVATSGYQAAAYNIDEQIAYIGSGLGGPKLSVDVACASSLYAIAQAMTMLHSGQASHVVVLALNLSMSFPVFSIFSHLGALDAEGRVRSYLSDAGGTFLGEAVAGIVLERSSTAVDRRANILGVIRGLGLSSDGAERSVFTPGAAGQRLMLERAYREVAGVPDYLEGHGTGTVAGDRAELEAMQQFFKDKVPANAPIALGSVKSLTGHALAAAGMVAVIKALLMIRHRQLPPHPAGKPHPLLTVGCLQLPTQAIPLPDHQRVMRVGISTMGIGGGNAHLVLESEAALQTTVAPERYTFYLRDVSWQYGEKRDAAFTRNDGEPAHFPSTLMIATEGLRSGPNFLRNISSFQLLALDKARQLFDRHAGLADSDHTAVMMHTNSGNEMFLQLNRRMCWLHSPGLGLSAEARMQYANALTLPIDNDVIVSSLPSMCAGYPAWHLNTRGFYLTSSGSMTDFYACLLNSLLLASEQGSKLIAGAGAYDDNSHPDEFVCWYLLDTAACDTAPVLLHYFPGSTPWAAIRKIGRQEEEVTVVSNAHPTELLHFMTGDSTCLAINVAGGTLLLERQYVMHPIPISKPQRPMSIRFDQRSAAAILFRQARATLLQEMQLAQETATARFASLQQKVLQLLEKSAAPPLLRLQHPVTGPLQLEGQRASAMLLVDETHPYFFDHPLDHVPGVLLLEGVSQLMTQLLLQQAPDDITADNYYFRRLEMRFTRLCACARPIEIVIRPQAAHADVYPYEGRVWQDEKVVATFTLDVAACLISLPVHILQPVRVVPGKQWLHKQREENVLVSELMMLEDGHIACDVYTPAAAHFFHEGYTTWYSPCFLLEISRQFFMLLSHQHYAIPLEQPMYLLDISYQLDQPPGRGQSLQLQHQPVAVRSTVPITGMQAFIYADGQRIGQFSAQSLILDKQPAAL